MGWFARLLKALTSKTVIGVSILALPELLGNPTDPTNIAKFVGTVVTAAGGRDMIDKVAATVGAAQGK